MSHLLPIDVRACDRPLWNTPAARRLSNAWERHGAPRPNLKPRLDSPDRPRCSLYAVDTPTSQLASWYNGMREAYLRDPMPPATVRERRLKALLKLLADNEELLASAVSADFGNHSRFEFELAGVITTLAEIKHTMRHLRRWMKPQHVSTPLYLFPARACIERQPVGVVGIISPWNYPIFLSIPPACGALAAGNRVLLKPSELTPRFGEVLQKLVAAHFAEDEFRVALGGRDIGEALCRLPLDHLFFTGSTRVGRAVAAAAAANLTPLTLELGGKSPAIVGKGNNGRVPDVARRVVFGKLVNAGQTCIAPDYVFVPRAMMRPFVSGLAEAAAALYPDAANNPQYTSLINDSGIARLSEFVAQVRAAGAEVITVGDVDQQSRRMPLQIVVNPPADSPLMREEIFGPVLPVLPYDSFDDVIRSIQSGPRPLALYYFGSDGREQRRVLNETVSGGVTINDVLWHIAHPNLPFGGVGESGNGAYHGEFSFRRFSHEKAVLVQSRWAFSPLLHPPYGRTAHTMLKVLRKLV
jgi:coniferyl-aldehyde dehydrogenase